MSITNIHPGEYIREELIARSWTQADLADITGRPLKMINQIIAGRNAISARTANELSKAFGTSAELWMNLQSSYELATEPSASEEIEQKAKIFDMYPVREARKRGWIKTYDTAKELEKELLSFWCKNKLEDIEEHSFAAKKTNQNEPFSSSHHMWVQQAVRMSAACDVAAYSKKKFEKHFGDLIALTTNPQEARHVPRILSSMGIRFVVVKHLSGTKIDGAAVWLDKNKKKPLIVLSCRFDRIDNFWHTLLHELAHVYFEDDTTVDVDLDGSSEVDIEIRANKQASEWLIEKRLIESFIRRHKPRFSRSKVIQFSNLHRIHPGIVVGQLHYRKALDYSKLRAMLSPVRHVIVAGAISDGWENLKIKKG